MTPNRRAVLALCFALPGHCALLAQAVVPPPSSPSSDESIRMMEAFTVTGSHIRRIDEEKALPITVLTTDELELRAVPTASELFETLSIGGPIVLDEGNTLGADARGDNVAINLRGIGSGNTLVLLNGRRLPPHPISQAESGVPSLSVNVNQLPAAALSRVEILRDGASATYGTDAAGGVVNSLTRTRYDGLAMRARGSMSQHGGGNDWNFEITDGRNFNRGRSNLLLALEFYHRDSISLGDRAFGKNRDIRISRNVPPPWDGRPVINPATGAPFALDNDFDNRLSDDSSNYGNYVRGNFDANGAFVGSRPTGNRGIVTASGSTTATTNTGDSLGVFYLIPLADGTTGFRQSLPSHNLTDPTLGWFYNHNKHRIMVPKTDRLSFNANLRHRLSGGHELFGELLLYRARSVTGRSPSGFDSSTDHNIYVSADHPFNPFGSRFFQVNGTPNADGTPRIMAAPADVLIAPATGVIPRDFKPRVITVDSEAMRIVTGLRGKLGGDWRWESAILYGRNQTHDEEDFAIRESRLRAALTTSDPAKAFNPFGYTFRVVPQANATNPLLLQVDRPYTNPAALTDSLYDTFVREGRTQMASWDLKYDGTVVPNFWGGPIAIALGFEFRWEDYRDWRPPYAGLNPPDAPFNGRASDATNLFFGPNENDFIAISPNVNLYASRTIGSAFTEIMLPFVSRRNSRPGLHALELTLAGRTERFSDFGSTAKPKVGLLYRMNPWLALRATSAGSFRAPNLVQTNTSPLQRSGDNFSDAYRYEVTGNNIDNVATPVIFRQGNAGLSPESSRSISAGVVLALPFYRNLTFTVDYWSIEQRDVIDDVTGTTQLRLDEELLDGAVQRALAAGTPISQIDLGSGTSEYQGNPKVVRSPVTAVDRTAFNNFNASRPATQQRAPVGSVRSIVTDYVNLAGREVQGMDFGVELRIPRTRFGQGVIRGDAAYLLQFDTQAEPGAVAVDSINRDGRTRFRGDVGATWRYEKWTAGWFSTYYGKYVDTGASTTVEIYEALGKPDYISNYVDSGGVRRYRYLVSGFWSHNTYVNYAIGRKRESLLNNLSLRFGVNNVFDVEPPLADEDSGYRRGVGTNARGRIFYTQISKAF